MNKTHKNRAGFTIIELIVAVGLFTFVVIYAIGITISVTRAERKSSDIQAVQDNIRFSLELMTKEMRTGSEFNLSTNCVAVSGQEITFRSTDSGLTPYRTYYLSLTAFPQNGIIKRIKSADPLSVGCGSAQDLTAGEVSVDALAFNLHNASVAQATECDGQPTIVINMRLHSSEVLYGAATMMSLQTTVVQRLRDIGGVGGGPSC